jgi:hypothetical protein
MATALFAVGMICATVLALAFCKGDVSATLKCFVVGLVLKAKERRRKIGQAGGGRTMVAPCRQHLLKISGRGLSVIRRRVAREVLPIVSQVSAGM